MDEDLRLILREPQAAALEVSFIVAFESLRQRISGGEEFRWLRMFPVAEALEASENYSPYTIY